MTERVVKVTLVAAANNYISNMGQASRATTKMSDEARKALAAQGSAFTSLGTTALKAGAVAAAGLGIAIAKFAQFDQAMSNVDAALQETSGNMALLREAALQAGADTEKSAVQAAGGIEELGKNGLTTAQILNGGLKGALALSTAGQLEVARAAEVAAISMKQFGKEGEDIPHIADLFAAGAGKAAGSAEDLAQALAQSGLVANGAGQSIEDTVGVLAAFADNALIGSDAGTSLKTAIIALQAPSEKASKVMDSYGLSFYDGAGQMLSFAGIADQLQSKLGDLDDETRNAALAQIFGTDAIRSANVLYKEGADGIQKYVDQTNDTGYAAKVAADRLDNLGGDLEKLAGSFETTLIKGGSGANDVLRDLVQTTTFLVDAVGDIPGPAADAGLAIGAAGAATLLAGGAAGVAIPKFQEFKTTLATLGVAGRSAALGIGAASGALAIATYALAALATDLADRASAIDSFGESLYQATGEITDYTRELVAQRLETEGAIDVGKRLGLSVDELVDLTLSGKDAITEWGEARRTANAEDAAAVTQYDTVSGALEIVSGQLDAGREAWDLNRLATEESRKATEANDDALAALAGSAEDAGESISDLADRIRGFGSATLDVREAERQFQAAIDDVKQSVKDNGDSLDVATEKGRANQASLDDLAKSALEASAAILIKTTSEEDAAAAIQDGRDALIDQLAQFKITGQAAEDYADELGLIPENVATTTKLLGLDDVEKDIKEFIKLYSGQTVRLNVDGSFRLPGGGVAKAAGGAVYGPGSGTSDDVPAMLSNGEHVLTAAEVAKAGGQGAIYRARQRLMLGGGLAFAKGGAVSLKMGTAGSSSLGNFDQLMRDFEAANRAMRELEFAAAQDRAQIQEAAAKEAAKKQEEAAEKLAKAIDDVAAGFRDIDLTGLAKEVMQYVTVTNADGSQSVFGKKGTAAVTAESIDGYFAGQNAGNQRFAQKLQQLSGLIPFGLLSYITSLGVEKGEPFADALLAGSSTTIASINANYNASQVSAGVIGGIVAPLGHAAGGAIYGAGTGTSDSNLRRLSNGEHVLSAAEVRALGGQGAVYAMRESWRAEGYGAGRGSYASSSSSGPTTIVNVVQNYQENSTASQRRNDYLATAKVAAL